MEARNTKQKDYIINIMSKQENMVHPTIQELTQIVNKDIKIGQATIYRNIKKLVKEGKIEKILTSCDGYRYDINTNLHGHLVCSKCGNIIDLYNNNYLKLVKKLEKEYGIKINNANFVFDGTCINCLKTNNKN